MAKFISLEQLQTALGRVKQYSEEAYAASSHKHDSSQIDKLSGYSIAAESASDEKHIKIANGDTLNIALGKIERSLENIVNNIGSIEDSEHNHDDRYFTEQEINQMLTDIESKITDDTGAALTSANSYTDTKIANLVGNASEALDTIYEIAAVLEDKSVVEGLASEIGKKVDKPTSATAGNVAIFSQGGNIEDSGYTIQDNVPSGAKFTDEKVKVTEQSSTKLYVTGATGAGTGELKYDSNIYIDEQTGSLVASSFVGKATSSATADKVNYALTIKVGGNTQASFDGSSAATVEITAASIGAIAAGEIVQATNQEVDDMLNTIFNN